MDRPTLLLELKISDNTTLKELKIIYSLIKYVPWNEKEILEVKRVHSIIKHRRGDNFYNPKSDLGIIWNDKDLLIDWNQDIKPVLSDKDLKLISFKELKSPF